MAQQMHATVTQVSPLRVRVDGATSDSPASALGNLSYPLNARVEVTIRNPEPPLITTGGAAASTENFSPTGHTHTHTHTEALSVDSLYSRGDIDIPSVLARGKVDAKGQVLSGTQVIAQSYVQGSGFYSSMGPVAATVDTTPYPDGLSHFSVPADGTWPTNFGNAFTVKNGGCRAFQIFVAKGGTTMYLRTANCGPWFAWTVIA